MSEDHDFSLNGSAQYGPISLPLPGSDLGDPLEESAPTQASEYFTQNETVAHSDDTSGGKAKRAKDKYRHGFELVPPDVALKKLAKQYKEKKDAVFVDGSIFVVEYVVSIVLTMFVTSGQYSTNVKKTREITSDTMVSLIKKCFQVARNDPETEEVAMVLCEKKTFNIKRWIRAGFDKLKPLFDTRNEKTQQERYLHITPIPLENIPQRLDRNQLAALNFIKKMRVLAQKYSEKKQKDRERREEI